MKHLTSVFLGKNRLQLAAGITFMVLSFPASAVPLLLEGPISAISANPDGSGSITVLGVVVDIPAGTSITTPTATLSMNQAVNTTPLPGRTQPGFIGGTAIIAGTSVASVNTADSLFMEPAENILGADVTSTPPDAIAIAGVPMVPISDVRLLAGPVTNDFGFEVDPATVPSGVDAVAEGYFSNDGSGAFQYFALTASGGDILNPGVTEVSVIRAQCRAGATPADPIELRVLGGVHDPAGGTVTIRDWGPTTFGTVTAVADVPPFGVYDFRVRTGFTVCPSSVTVEFSGASTVAAVAGGSPDVDGDGVRDDVDNCVDVANGPLIPDAGGFIQRDTDADGFGNICDADLSQDGTTVVNLSDYALFRSAFGDTAPGTEPYGPVDHADFTGDGVVNLSDFSIFRAQFGGEPGPSGLNP